MKSIVITYAFLISATLNAFSQNCTLALKDGAKLKLDILTWTNPLLTDSKFQKAKDEQKDQKILEYNDNVATGKVPPASTYPMIYTVKKAAVPEGDEYTMTTVIAGKEYNSYVVCSNDTLYIARNRGPVTVPDAKGGIFGYTIQGIQKVPMNVKIGDELSSFEDISVIFGTATDDVVKKKVFSHNSTSTSNEFGFATDSRTGETGFGNYTKTTTRAVYRTIDVAVRKTLSFSGHTIHYINAKVTGEEEVIVGGVKYKAFVIESESWSKQKMDMDYESADAAVAREQEELFKKGQQKVEKMMVRKGYTNPLGYMVSYKKELFVPTIGMVRTQGFDTNGGISGQVVLAGIE